MIDAIHAKNKEKNKPDSTSAKNNTINSVNFFISQNLKSLGGTTGQFLNIFQKNTNTQITTHPNIIGWFTINHKNNANAANS